MSATTVLALLAPRPVCAAEAATEARRAIQSGLPRYDPAAYEKAQAEKETRAAPRNAPAPVPDEKVAAPVSATATPAGENILILPKVTVHGRTDPPKRLPRIDTTKPVEVEKTDPFESEAGRDARLVKKHLNKLQQVLIPLFGGSVTGEARAAGRDPEEIKKLRAEYVKLYYSGPK